MTTPDPDPHDARPGTQPGTEDAPATAPDPERAKRDEQAAIAAERVGGTLGRFAGRWARKARAAGEEIAREARPEADQLVKRARAAADAARPHVVRAGREAAQYAREHQDEIKDAARTGAAFTARRAVPLPLRPIVEAVEADRRRRPPLRDDRAPDLASDAKPDGPADEPRSR